MNPKIRLALSACAINVMFVATAHAVVIHDKNGNAVEPATPADTTDLVPTGKGYVNRNQTFNNISFVSLMPGLFCYKPGIGRTD